MTTIALKLTRTTVKPAARRIAQGRRPFGHVLEAAAVLSLMGSSAAYAVCTLLNLA